MAATVIAALDVMRGEVLMLVGICLCLAGLGFAALLGLCERGQP